MKLCYKCQVKKIARIGCSYCKGCANERNKNYYKQHPESIRNSTSKHLQEIRKFVISKKNVPCTDCHKKYHWYVMDFDHREQKEKLFGIANQRGGSLEKVKIEISKCDVVCANCHRIRTFKTMENKKPPS